MRISGNLALFVPDVAQRGWGAPAIEMRRRRPGRSRGAEQRHRARRLRPPTAARDVDRERSGSPAKKPSNHLRNIPNDIGNLDQLLLVLKALLNTYFPVLPQSVPPVDRYSTHST